MSDSWMPHLRLQIPPEQFRALPRNPAYKYELLGGETWISPRPKYYHARLDLASHEAALPASVPIKPLHDGEWPRLTELFMAAFARHQPFAGAGDRLREAAEKSLEQTRTGGDGPLIRPACLVAEDARGDAVGAALVTLVPDKDPEGWDSFLWREPADEGTVARREGWPHLTWIFVAPFSAGHGVGTALLAGVVRELRGLGFADLLSTFLVGNESSMMWHWRNGFRLLSYPGSWRRLHRRHEGPG